MHDNYADRLSRAILDKKSPLCVGLDPVYDRLPAEFRDTDTGGDPLEAGAEAITRYCKRVCELVVDHAATVKPQLAYFETFGAAGVRAAAEVARHARELGLLVIGDLKRGDIGSTADAFATAYFGETTVGDDAAGAFAWDAITVNPYMGVDAIRPFLPYCRDHGKGIYVLVRTSNPSSREIQSLIADGSPIFHHVARLVDEWGADSVGECGYSAVGAVVGATFPAELDEARNLMPRTPFLIPGVGAQGGAAADVLGALGDRGIGGVVNSSRGILYAFEKSSTTNWETAVTAAASELREELWQGITVDA